MAMPIRWFVISIKRYLLVCLFITIITTLIYCIFILNSKNSNKYPTVHHLERLTTVISAKKLYENELISAKLYNNTELRLEQLKKKVERISRKVRKSKAIALNSKSTLKPNYNVHIFYYAWYSNPEIDGAYSHWNHKYLPNWKREDHKVYPTGSHEPPIDIGSNYYPQLGCYSSSDPKVIDTHFRQIRETGVGVVVLSWSPPEFTDSPDKILPLMFDIAQKYNLKISPHIEPYHNRNPINLYQHLKTFLNKYANHPALYKLKKPLSNVEVPVFYVYDSYLVPATAWKELLSVKGNLSIRGTKYDAIFIGLLVDMQHRYHIKKSHFDGFYTYFACNGFTYGSSWKNWRSLAKFAKQNALIYIPSVGPGYIDTQVRPWNSASTRYRRHGQYYEVAWRTAINSKVNYISVTSFNEWHEGTQIEPAIEKSINGFTYLNYEPEGPNFYLNLTKWWIDQFDQMQIN